MRLVGGGLPHQYYYYTTMVRQKSLKAQELEIQLAEAVLGVQTGKYKSSYEASKAIGISKDTIN
jgi:hypothetical protein